MHASLALQILPLGQSEQEVVRIVDAVIAHIKASGLAYEVGPFETTVEGDFDSLLALYASCQKMAIEAGADKVACYSKFFYSKAPLLTTEEKVGKHRRPSSTTA